MFKFWGDINSQSSKSQPWLIIIWSHLGLLPTGPEKHLRSLAVEVAAELPDDSSSMDALKRVLRRS